MNKEMFVFNYPFLEDFPFVSDMNEGQFDALVNIDKAWQQKVKMSDEDRALALMYSLSEMKIAALENKPLDINYDEIIARTEEKPLAEAGDFLERFGKSLQKSLFLKSYNIPIDEKIASPLPERKDNFLRKILRDGECQTVINQYLGSGAVRYSLNVNITNELLEELNNYALTENKRILYQFNPSALDKPFPLALQIEDYRSEAEKCNEFAKSIADKYGRNDEAASGVMVGDEINNNLVRSKTKFENTDFSALLKNIENPNMKQALKSSAGSIFVLMPDEFSAYAFVARAANKAKHADFIALDTADKSMSGAWTLVADKYADIPSVDEFKDILQQARENAQEVECSQFTDNEYAARLLTASLEMKPVFTVEGLPSATDAVFLASVSEQTKTRLGKAKENALPVPPPLQLRQGSRNEPSQLLRNMKNAQRSI